MPNLLLLSTKNIHFCFGGDIYQQNDGVAMAPWLGPVLAGTFIFLIGEDMYMIHLYL